MQLTQSQLNTQPKNPNPSIGLFLMYIFVSAALVIFIAYPKFSDWRSSNTQLLSDRQKLAQVQASAAQVTLEIADMQPSDLSKIVTAVPSTPNLPDLYAQIESLANASNVHLVSIQGIIDDAAAANGSTATAATGTTDTVDGSTPVVGPIAIPPVPSSLNTISLSLDVNGSYDADQQFLNLLYTSLRIVTIQQTVMSSSKSSTNSSNAVSPNAPATIDLKARLQAYYSGNPT